MSLDSTKELWGRVVELKAELQKAKERLRSLDDDNNQLRTQRFIMAILAVVLFSLYLKTLF